MSKEPKEKVRLCPFKKMTDRETDPNTGKTVTHELFEPCAGERCMAYSEGDADLGVEEPYCLLATGR